MIGAVAAGLAFWLLMTADLSLANVAMGLAGSAAIAWLAGPAIPAKKILGTTVKVFAVTLPVALVQALWLVAVAHPVEETAWETPPEGSADSWDTLARIFEITLTPLTLALDTDDRGKIKVHFLKRKREK
jgi:multisubunit Na+/H+ antiporter MnhE subunit